MGGVGTGGTGGWTGTCLESGGLSPSPGPGCRVRVRGRLWEGAASSALRQAFPSRCGGVREEHHRQADEVSAFALSEVPEGGDGRAPGLSFPTSPLALTGSPWPQDYPPGWVLAGRVPRVHCHHLRQHAAVHPRHRARHDHAQHPVRRLCPPGVQGGRLSRASGDSRRETRLRATVATNSHPALRTMPGS